MVAWQIWLPHHPLRSNKTRNWGFYFFTSVGYWAWFQKHPTKLLPMVTGPATPLFHWLYPCSIHFLSIHLPLMVIHLLRQLVQVKTNGHSSLYTGKYRLGRDRLTNVGNNQHIKLLVCPFLIFTWPHMPFLNTWSHSSCQRLQEISIAGSET